MPLTPSFAVWTRGSLVEVEVAVVLQTAGGALVEALFLVAEVGVAWRVEHACPQAAQEAEQ
jgi:hypothetical protein